WTSASTTGRPWLAAAPPAPANSSARAAGRIHSRRSFVIRRRVDMRVLPSLCLMVALGATGCSSVCDEVADEAEAGGCAKGVLPDVDDDELDDLTTCEGAREAKAQCYLDLSQNVCAITENEAAALEACLAAAQNTSNE